MSNPRDVDEPNSANSLLTRRQILAASTAAAGGTVIGNNPVAAQAGHERYDETIESHDGTQLAATVYRPAGASADNPVPMILQSHGWSSSRTSADGAFQRELDRGFGVLSFSQRGHGESSGQAWTQNPELEGRDVISVLDYVEGLEWVARSDSGSGSDPPGNENSPIEPPGLNDEDDTDDTEDPMVFAMGQSYGGAFQFVGALTEIWLKGYTRFDALAPEISWYNLSEALAPRGVVRTAWNAFLYASGASMLPEHVHRSFAYGLTTGQWPNGDLPGAPDLDARFYRNGPSGFVETNLERGAYPGEEDFSDEFVAEEIRLDVPVLLGHGLSDNLFNLNQGWKNFKRTLTDDARERSALVGFNGGHQLPSVLPLGTHQDARLGRMNQADACSPDGDFGELRLQFFEAIRDGTGDARDVVGSTYKLTTADDQQCVAVDSLDDCETLAAGVDLAVANDGAGNLELERVAGVDDRTVTTGDSFPGEFDPETVEAAFAAADVDGGTAATPTGGGTPIHFELQSGPLTVAGIPNLSATVTTIGVEQRVFFALSVGDSPATARIVQNNMLPLREPEPVAGVERTIELPGVATQVAEGETLYLTVSAVSDMSFGHGSARTPGSVVLEDLTVDVPLVD